MQAHFSKLLYNVHFQHVRLENDQKVCILGVRKINFLNVKFTTLLENKSLQYLIF